MIRIKFFLLLFFLIWIISGKIVPADASSSLADSLIAHGVDQYEKGDIKGAVQDFSRALLIEADNSVAKNNLFALRDEDHLDSLTKLNLLKVEDIVNQIQHLTQKKAYLEGSKQYLEKLLVRQGIKTYLIEQQLAPLKPKRLAGKTVLSSSEESPQALDSLAQVFMEQKDELTNSIVFLQKQCNFLRGWQKNNIYTNLIETAAIRSSTPGSSALSKQKFSSSRFLKATPFNRDGYLLKQIALVRQKVDDLELEANKKDEKVLHLTQQVIDLSLRMSESDIVLEKKDNNYEVLNQQLADLKSRFDLGQRIIQDKDERIDQLDIKVEKLQAQSLEYEKEFNSLLASKDQKLIELNGILQIYKSKLSDVSHEFKNSASGYTVLKEQLALIQQEMQEKNLIIARAKEDITQLESQLAQLRDELQHLKDAATDARSSLEINSDVSRLQTKLLDINYFLEHNLDRLDNIQSHLSTQPANFPEKLSE